MKIQPIIDEKYDLNLFTTQMLRIVWEAIFDESIEATTHKQKYFLWKFVNDRIDSSEFLERSFTDLRIVNLRFPGSMNELRNEKRWFDVAVIQYPFLWNMQVWNFVWDSESEQEQLKQFKYLENK